MVYRPRLVAAKVKRLFNRFPIVVVVGARQVGKTTLLRNEFPDFVAVEFDPVIDVANAREDSDLFLDNHPSPLILDEIQFAPELVAALKRRVDRQQKPGLYLLTGSQQWQVLRSASESLAGRAVFVDLEGFCMAELASQPGNEHWLKRYLDAPEEFLANPGERISYGRSLYDCLWRGWLPGAAELELEDVVELHRAYLRTYVERDVRLLSEVGDWQQFGRFVQLMAALTAQEQNGSQMAREIGATPQTAQRWLGMLRATFQWFETPAFCGNFIKRISSRPKGYFADTGFACALQRISTPAALAGHPLAGALFETAVAGEVRKLSATLSTPPILYHWRSHGGAEVDLLLERDGVYFPLEIKLSSHPSRGAARGIQAFRESYPQLKVAPGLVIAPCEKVLRLAEHAYALPWDLKPLKAILP